MVKTHNRMYVPSVELAHLVRYIALQEVLLMIRNPATVFVLLFAMTALFTPLLPAADEGESEKMSAKEFTLRPIGVVDKSGERTTLVLNREVEPALLGLDGFSHVWVFWWFDGNDTPEKRSILQVHPRADKNNPLTGVFACRSPVRPNLIALTLCRVLSVEGNQVEVDEIDAYADTPILDLKPYIPGSDAVDASVPGWLGGHGTAGGKAAGKTGD
jgi:tRNA-Thr(GGU) m(6)t(6)A37 methyltransferase TsaA